MSDWALFCYDLLFHPTHAFPKQALHRYWGLAACTLFLATLLHALTQAGSYHQSLLLLLPQFLIHAGAVFLLWIFFSLVVNLSADLFGGKGRIIDTMTSLGLAGLPFVLLAPVKALPNVLGTPGFSLELLLSIGICFWVLVLCVLGIQAVHQLSLDKAIGSLVISGVISLGLGFLGIITALSHIIFSLQTLIL